MAKEKIALTKEILADILEKNPNKTYTEIVEILNKGTPFVKYVTPGMGYYSKYGPNVDEIKKTIKLVNQLGYEGAAKKLKKNYPAVYATYNKYKDGIPETKPSTTGGEFTNTKLAYHARNFGLDDKILGGTVNRQVFSQLDPNQAKNVKGFLEELVKSDGKVKISGISKGNNFFRYVDDTLKKASKENPSKFPYSKRKTFDGEKIYNAIFEYNPPKSKTDYTTTRNIRRAADSWSQVEGKGLVNITEVHKLLGTKNGYNLGSVRTFLTHSQYDKPEGNITKRQIDLARAFMSALEDAGVKKIDKGGRTYFDISEADKTKLNQLVKPSGFYANTLRAKIAKFSRASNDYKKFGGGKDYKKLNDTRASLNKAITEAFGSGLKGSEKATKLKILDFLNNNKTLYDQLSLDFDPSAAPGKKIFNRDLSKLSAEDLLKGMKVEIDHIKTIKQMTSNLDKFSFDDARISETAFNRGLATKYFNTSFKNRILNHLERYPNDKDLIKELKTKLKGTGAIFNINNKFVGDRPNPIISKQIDRLGFTDLFTKSADPDLLQGLGDQASFYKTLYKSIDNLPYQNKKLIARVLDCKIGKEEGGVTGQLCVKKIQEEPVESLNKLSKLNVTEGPLGQVKGVAQRMLNVLPRLGTVGKIGTVAAGAGIALSGLRYNPEKGEIVTTDNDQKADQNQILQYVKDNPLKVTAGSSLGFAAQEVPGAYKAARDLGRGRVRSTLGISGAIRPVLTTFGTPLLTGLYEGAIGSKRLDEGETMTEILTDPVGPALGLTLMEPLSKLSGVVKDAPKRTMLEGAKNYFNLSNVGKARPGITGQILRMGMSPKMIAGASRFLGLPGLALGLGMSGYDAYKNYQNQEGMIYNLFNRDE